MRRAPIALSVLLVGIWGGGCGSASGVRAVGGTAPSRPGPRKGSAVTSSPGRAAAGLRVRARAPAREYRIPAEVVHAPAALRPLVAACARAASTRGVALRWDPRLAAAARVLSRLPSGSDLTPGVIRFALLAAGVPEPRARAGIASAPGGRHAPEPAPSARGASSPGPHARSLAAVGLCQVISVAGYNRLGAVLLPRSPRRLLWVALESQLVLGPVPKRAAPGTSVLLRGRLSPGFSSPRTLITGPDGVARPLRLVAAADQSFHALVPLARGPGVYQVEVVAHGPDGPTVLANAPLYVGVPAPDAYLLREAGAGRAAPGGPRALARALWRRLQQARVAAGLAPLRWAPRLAQVARAHAFEMCRARRVSHVTLGTGAAADRVRAAGLRVAWVGENVGEGASVAALHRAFQASPGHRAVRLAPRAKAGGVGVCVQVTPVGRQTLFVTELFVR